MWARIDNTGIVAETTNQDPKGRFHPSIKWVECSDDVRPGHAYDGESFSEPPGESLEEVAQRKRREIEAAYATALLKGVPYTMPDGTDDVIQTRPEDESNLLGLAIEARDLRDAGETEAVMELRAQSNQVYELTPAQMIDATDGAKAHKKALLKQSWQRKGEVAAALQAEDRSALEAIEWSEG